MMALKLYNSLTRQKEIFNPIDPNHIKMYVCGPTVYSYAHIGNARATVVFDILRRVLEARYPKVTHVANITDIEDKIIEAARQIGEPIDTITKKYAQIYNDDMASLGVLKPTIQPWATHHVDGMITMIETLIQKGNAYEKDSHVLFHVPSYKNYGALSGRNYEEQCAGARVEIAPYKKDPADFILWKPSNENQPGWDSPWGFGRPGWHIECSVMAKEFLGDVFDIHGGGLDLTFPHHENELAQSCCANGNNRLANYWMHNGFVTVESEKMSKSLGNVLLVHDMISNGTPGEAIRLCLISTHYRQPFDWTQDGLDQAIKTLDKWYEIIEAYPPQDSANTPHEEVTAAMADDLNTPLAISILHKLAKDRSPYLKPSLQFLGLATMHPKDWSDIRKAQKSDIDVQKIEALIAVRNAARAQKNFTEADAARDELNAMGVAIKDGPNGTEWHVL